MPYTALQTMTSVLTTEMNSLANGNTCALGPEITADGKPLGEWILDLATLGGAASADAIIELYYCIALDGVGDYASSGSGATAPPLAHFVVAFPVPASVGPHEIHLRGVEMPVGPVYKCQVRNLTGQPLAASGNTLRFRSYDLAPGS